ncbi:hypothetical protein ACLM5J_13440 [Nocardioides sp. Bht2]|uniref:hypothetical protein n=1 Tax=Nocardioides sp. Bht2 TaxID=3392297 RepID=UPI0039B3F6C8
MNSPLHLARIGAVATVGLLAFSACGSQTVRNEAHPGAAVVVGKQQIALDAVDDLTQRYCDLYLKANGDQASALPLQVLRNDSVQLLTDAEVARQYAAAEELDVQGVRSWLMQQSDDAAAQYGLSGRELKDFAQISARVDTQAVYLAAGGQNGPVVDQAAAQQALAVGQRKVQQWADGLEIERDPRFAPATAEGYHFNAGSLAEPVSQIAKAIEAYNGTEQPDSAYVDALPAAQKCAPTA